MNASSCVRRYARCICVTIAEGKRKRRKAPSGHIRQAGLVTKEGFFGTSSPPPPLSLPVTERRKGILDDQNNPCLLRATGQERREGFVSQPSRTPCTPPPPPPRLCFYSFFFLTFVRRPTRVTGFSSFSCVVKASQGIDNQ